MNRLVAALVVLPVLALSPQAQAQAQNPAVVASCGTPPTTYTPGSNKPPTVDTTGRECGQITGSTTDSGTKINSATMPTGGVGLTGWMSAVWYQLTQILSVKIDQTTPGTTNGVQVNAALPVGANVIGKTSIDQTTPGTTNGVVTGTYGRVDASPTVQNASYISGNDIGGLVTFALPATASGILQSISIQFVGGATTAITANCYDTNPAASTFTDKSTYTIAAADTPKMINKSGIVLTPAVSIGGTRSAAVFDNYAKPFGSTGTIWCSYAAGGTFTPASVSDMNVSIAYYQNAK